MNKKIACLGSGSGVAGEPSYDAMVEVGDLLARAGHTVITGGFGGAGMEAPAKGAKEAGGQATGYTLFGKQGNPHLTQTVDCYEVLRSHANESGVFRGAFFTSLDPMVLAEIQYGVRLGLLLQGDHFIICPGGPGTMAELMAIINLNAKLWNPGKRVAILNLHETDGTGWGWNMLNQLVDWKVLPTEVLGLISVVSTPEKAVKWVTT